MKRLEPKFDKWFRPTEAEEINKHHKIGAINNKDFFYLKHFKKDLKKLDWQEVRLIIQQFEKMIEFILPEFIAYQNSIKKKSKTKLYGEFIQDQPLWNLSYKAFTKVLKNPFSNDVNEEQRYLIYNWVMMRCYKPKKVYDRMIGLFQGMHKTNLIKWFHIMQRNQFDFDRS